MEVNASNVALFQVMKEKKDTKKPNHFQHHQWYFIWVPFEVYSISLNTMKNTCERRLFNPNIQFIRDELLSDGVTQHFKCIQHLSLRHKSRWLQNYYRSAGSTTVNFIQLSFTAASVYICLKCERCHEWPACENFYKF